MKKITFLIASIVALSSCNLDRFPLSSLAPENFYNSREELEVATNKFYSNFPDGEDIYGETADIIIPTTLTESVLGTRTVPTSGGGWEWGTARTVRECHNPTLHQG